MDTTSTTRAQAVNSPGRRSTRADEVAPTMPTIVVEATTNWGMIITQTAQFLGPGSSRKPCKREPPEITA
jgi:hypothetical protein